MLVSDVNQIVTGAGALFRLKEVLKLMGGTIPSSSDGITYNSSGDQITHAGSGPGGMANASAWFRYREPGAGRREVVFQRATSSNQQWYVKYSALSRFTSGSPSATRVPAAADERLLLGAGTDASPTFGNMFTSDNAYRVHIVGNTVPISGVYPINMFCTATPGSVQTIGQFTIEPMAPGFNTADQDPCLVRFTTTAQGNYMGWLGYGTGSATWITGFSTDTIITPGSIAADLASGDDVNLRPRFTASSGGERQKGWGSTLAVMGPSRTYPATLNTQGIAGGKPTDAHVYLNGWCMPYPNNTVPGV